MNIFIYGRTPNPTDSPEYRNSYLGSLSSVLDIVAEFARAPIMVDEQTYNEFGDKLGIDVQSFRTDRLTEKLLNKEQAIGIAVGGDGTMLQAAKLFTLANIPVVGVNLGKIGFITDISVDDLRSLKTLLIQFQVGSAAAETRTILWASTKQPELRAIAANDVVISRNGSRIIEFDVLIDNVFAFHARADGLMISTPTGSTAYALATGAPIIQPKAKVFEVIPMMPQTFSQRPIVVDDQSTIFVQVTSGEADVTLDGELSTIMRPNDALTIKRASNSMTFLHPNDYDYLASLRSKLGWQHLPMRK